MSDWADKIQQKILCDAGVLHLESLKARIGTSIADELRNARAAALEEAAQIAEAGHAIDFKAEHKEYATGYLESCDDTALALRAMIPKPTSPSGSGSSSS